MSWVVIMGGECMRETTYHICLAVHFPDAPFALVSHHLLDHLLSDAGAFSSALLWSRARRYEDRPLPLGVRIDLVARHHTPPLTPADVLPPRDQLLGVFEAARAHVEPVQHGRVVVAVSPPACLAPVWIIPPFVVMVERRCCSVGVAVALRFFAALGAVPRKVAQHLLAVVRRVPGAEADIAQHDFIDVAVRLPRAVGGPRYATGRPVRFRGRIRAGRCYRRRHDYRLAAPHRDGLLVGDEGIGGRGPARVPWRPSSIQCCHWGGLAGHRNGCGCRVVVDVGVRRPRCSRDSRRSGRLLAGAVAGQARRRRLQLLGMHRYVFLPTGGTGRLRGLGGRSIGVGASASASWLWVLGNG